MVKKSKRVYLVRVDYYKQLLFLRFTMVLPVIPRLRVPQEQQQRSTTPPPRPQAQLPPPLIRSRRPPVNENEMVARLGGVRRVIFPEIQV